MKKQLLFLAIWTLVASSCNYISNPIPKDGGTSDGKDCKEQPFPPYTSKKVVLLEDYTGHTCLNCPAATKIADGLKKKYPEQVIVVAIHAGGYAAYKRPPFTQNFTTEAGDFYDGTKGFTVSALGNPNGLVNRKDYPIKKQVKNKDQWGPEISALLSKPVEADLQLMSEYNSSTGKACIFVQYKLPPTLTGNYKLTVMLTQDSIIGPQVDGNANNIIQNYVFNDMLRANINLNGTWGDDISVGNGAWTLKKYEYTVQSAYNNIVCEPEHCHVVAFIYDNADYRILQAAEVELKK